MDITHYIVDLELQYVKLLLKISIERASAQTGNPLNLMESNTFHLKMADQDVKVQPWETTLIVNDTGASIWLGLY